MQVCEHKLETAAGVEAAMGFEGNAAREYFNALGILVNVPEFKFSGRSRRPPKNAFNSMLSLGYSILMSEIYGAIESKGLNPYFGFIHSDREKHPTLASDLMEEWRAVIVDSVVMSLVNGHEIAIDEFVANEETGGVFLTRDGMRTFIKKLEGRFAANAKYLEYAAYSVSFRRAISMQVGELCKAIEQRDSSLYNPVIIR
jgi:CRISPR-associated protein Cas1